jgi:polysaccharide pyruvyl transferase WcaK-like protein
MIGARMHACIAGLSQAVATVTLAYSKKARGTLDALGDAAPVADLRAQTVDQVIEQIADSYERRRSLAAELSQRLPAVRKRVDAFFDGPLRSLVDQRLGGQGRRTEA